MLINLSKKNDTSEKSTIVITLFNQFLIVVTRLLRSVNGQHVNI